MLFNAALVIKKRAIKLIINSGTELSKRGILISGKDKGRGDTHKAQVAMSRQKRKEQSPSTALWPNIISKLREGELISKESIAAAIRQYVK